LLLSQDREYFVDGKGKRKASRELGEELTKGRLAGDVDRRWEPPADGWIKINVDGAFEESGRAEVGLVIRDHQGTILLSGWKSNL
jgi:hypothetical protein